MHTHCCDDIPGSARSIESLTGLRRPNTQARGLWQIKPLADQSCQFRIELNRQLAAAWAIRIDRASQGAPRGPEVHDVKRLGKLKHRIDNRPDMLHVLKLEMVGIKKIQRRGLGAIEVQGCQAGNIPAQLHVSGGVSGANGRRWQAVKDSHVSNLPFFCLTPDIS